MKPLISAWFFLYMVLFLQVVRSFIVVHSTSDPLVERSFVLVLSTYFPFLPEKDEKRILWESNPGLFLFKYKG